MKNFNNEMLTNVDVIECVVKGYELPVAWHEYDVLAGTTLYRVAPLRNFITEEEYMSYCEDPCSLILNSDLITADILYAITFNSCIRSKSIDVEFIVVNKEKECTKELFDILEKEVVQLIHYDNANVKKNFLEDCDTSNASSDAISVVDRLRCWTEYLYAKNDEISDTDISYSHTLEMVPAINIKDENDPKKVTYDCYTINAKSDKEENQYKVHSRYMHGYIKENFPSWVTALYWNSLESDTCYEIRFIINPNQTNLLKKPGFVAELKSIADKLASTSNCDLALSGKPIKTSVYVAKDMVEVVYEEDKGE